MNHPTKQQVQVVIDNLLKAAARADQNCPVNMDKAAIDVNHPCGTPMCHGGWYAIVAAPEYAEDILAYQGGARVMAEHLGFDDIDGLVDWADAHEDLWGNEWGSSMFSASAAFGLDDDELTSLHQIIDHWRGVESRLPA